MSQSLTRRSLVQASAGALAAVALKRDLLAAPRPHAGMHFGLVTYQWGRDMTLPELLSNCEKAGLYGVELRTEHKHGVEPSLSAAERADVRKRFSDSPVELVGYGSNCQYHESEPEKLKANIQLTKKYIELMHDCGGSGVKVKPNGFPKGVTREKTIEQIGKALNEVAEYGQGYGQAIRVEVHGGGTSALPVMRDIFRLADHPNVHVCWNCNGEDLAGAGLEANFNMVKDRFGDTVHVREMNEGEYPYPKLMKMFTDIDYQGWILLEARTEPDDIVAAMIEQRELFEQLTAAKARVR